MKKFGIYTKTGWNKFLKVINEKQPKITAKDILSVKRLDFGCIRCDQPALWEVVTNNQSLHYCQKHMPKCAEIFFYQRLLLNDPVHPLS